MDAGNTEAISYQAAELAKQLRHHLLMSGTSFCFETVFSHPSKIDFLADAKSRGYEIILVYIHLRSVELNLARIAQRVEAGGHNVPKNKVISRIPRTMQYVRDALMLADTAELFDNSLHSKPFTGVAYLHQGMLETLVNPLPEWAKKCLLIIFKNIGLI